MEAETTTENMHKLNDMQQQAVHHENGPLLILAGAGTGKTKVLTSRIIHLIENGYAYSSQILAVTFTNKAAREMVNRVNSNVDANELWIGTFHSIAAKILRRYADLFDLSTNYTIIGADEQLKIIKNLMKDNGIDDKKYNAKIILYIIQRWKDSALKPSNISNSDLKSDAHYIARELYELYQNKLSFLDAVDFGDLLIYNIELLNNNAEILDYYHNKFKYILVDEYQDTNVAQYIWIRLLTNKDKNICCVGDEDQSIYSWRGAEIGNILRFERDFPSAKVIRLEQNYRSTNNILNAASHLISYNKQRLGKNLWTDAGSGKKIKIVTTYDNKEEARFIAHTVNNYYIQGTNYSDMAVLVRAGFQTREIEECFIDYNIPYKIVGGLKFYERQEIKDVVAYIRATVNPADSLAIERIINLPKRGIGNVTLKKIIDRAAKENLPILVAISKMLDEGEFKGKIANTLRVLIDDFATWKNLFSYLPVHEAADRIVIDSGYMKMWEQSPSLESEDKIKNIKELIQALKGFENINEFIEHVSLTSDNDSKFQDNVASIMTMHAAKGLEFDIVITPGWEETIFPTQRAIDESIVKSIEEERRLAYVAITRAKKELYITKASCRNIFGQWQNNTPSRFIAELPEKSIINTNYNHVSNYYRANHKPVENNDDISDHYLRVGGRVKHQKFGSGYIVSIIDNQIEVSFDDYGTKRLMSSFLQKES